MNFSNPLLSRWTCTFPKWKFASSKLVLTYEKIGCDITERINILGVAVHTDQGFLRREDLDGLVICLSIVATWDGNLNLKCTETFGSRESHSRCATSCTSTHLLYLNAVRRISNNRYKVLNIPPPSFSMQCSIGFSRDLQDILLNVVLTKLTQKQHHVYVFRLSRYATMLRNKSTCPRSVPWQLILFFYLSPVVSTGFSHPPNIGLIFCSWISYM